MSDHNKEIPSIVKGMFFGEIHEEIVFPFPHFNESQREMSKEMCNAVNKFCESQVDSVKMDETSQIPDEIMQGLAGLGLFGLAVEENYGGLNLDYSLYARVFQEVAGIDGSLATMLGAHQSIGFKALMNEGNAKQKEEWLPKLASGEVVASFCLTEPGSGSDAYSIKTKAKKNTDNTYTINGQKLWITNAGTSGFYSVFCKTDHEVNGKTVEKISCFIVEKTRTGISFGEKEKKMGIKASETRAVYFDNVIVPATNMIGEPGQGFKIAMNVLNTGRLSLGSGCVGGMKVILKLAINQAKGRKQFGKSIAEFGLIQDKLAHMAAHCYAAESIVYMSTGQIIKGLKEYSMESAVCKVYCSEALWNTIDQAMQIAAGNGYMKEYPYERIMRDSRINLIFEGTNEILRCFLALSGIKEPSEDLKEVGKAADVSKALQDPIKSLGVLSDFAKKRIGKMVSTKHLTKVHPSLQEHADDFIPMLNDFSIKVENSLMKHGSKIIDQELVQMRLANMVIELYVSIAVMSRSTSILNDPKISDDDKAYISGLTEIALKESRHKFMENAKRMDKNYDREVKTVTEALTQRESYGLDIINF
ncbi:MAG: acyl-CoA dehydrogenase family protein [Bacteriovoracaceae bacterium]